MITSAEIENHFAAEAELHNSGYRREVFMFRSLVVKRIYHGYKCAKDLNYHEFHNYRKISAKIPEELKINFQTVYQVLEVKEQSYLLTEAIFDDTNQPSRNIADLGPLADPPFWSRLDKVMRFLAESDLCLTDLHAKNVIVLKIAGPPTRSTKGSGLSVTPLPSARPLFFQVHLSSFSPIPVDTKFFCKFRTHGP